MRSAASSKNGSIMSASTCGTHTASSRRRRRRRALRRRRRGGGRARDRRRARRRRRRARACRRGARPRRRARQRVDRRRHRGGAGGERRAQVAPRIGAALGQRRLGGGGGARDRIDAEQRRRRLQREHRAGERDAARPSTARPGARRRQRGGFIARLDEEPLPESRRSSRPDPVAAEPAANRRARRAHLERGRRFDRALQHARRVVAEKGRAVEIEDGVRIADDRAQLRRQPLAVDDNRRAARRAAPRRSPAPPRSTATTAMLAVGDARRAFRSDWSTYGEPAGGGRLRACR